MKVLVTGSDGQLGSALIHELKKRNIDFFAANRKNMDLDDEIVTKDVIRDFAPDIVYHCAAYTNVEKAELEKELCFKINVFSTKIISQVCSEIGCKFVYISTDFVFDGKNNQPYNPQDNPNPINYYGQTKFQGEQEVTKLLKRYFIIRTSWVFGEFGNNFVSKMLKLSENQSELKIVSDEYGSPTYTKDLAISLMNLLESNSFGIYHLCNEGHCSRYDFAIEIFKTNKVQIELTPIKANYFDSNVNRPKYTVLNQNMNPDSLIKINRTWQEALHDFLNKRAK